MLFICIESPFKGVMARRFYRNESAWVQSSTRAKLFWKQKKMIRPAPRASGLRRKRHCGEPFSYGEVKIKKTFDATLPVSLLLLPPPMAGLLSCTRPCPGSPCLSSVVPYRKHWASGAVLAPTHPDHPVASWSNAWRCLAEAGSPTPTPKNSLFNFSGCPNHEIGSDYSHLNIT
jgi:hypothetical protein